MIKKEYILQNPGILTLNSEELFLEENTNRYYCETLYTAISSGTEVAAYYGEKPLRVSGGYPRKLGYLNLSQVVSAPIKGGKYKVGDLVLTNESHCDRFFCTDIEILTSIPDSNKVKAHLFSYIYHMAYSTIFGYQVIPQTGLKNVGIIGNGLISQAIVEICLERNIQSILVSEHDSVLVNSNNFGKLTKLCRGELGPEHYSSYSVVVVCTNNWKDYEIALKLVDKGGCIVLLGFPGRNDEKPSFNPFEPTLFYVKNIKVASLPTTRLDLDNSEEKWLSPNESIAQIVSLINSGRLGEISRKLPTISYTELGEAYENLKNGLNRPLSYVLKW